MPGVYFIPSAKDDLSTHTRILKDKAANHGPIQLLSNDAWLLTKNLSLCGSLFRPLCLERPLPDVDQNKKRIFCDYCLIGLLSCLEMPLFVAAVPAFLLLPGWMFALAAAAGYGVVLSVARLTWGDLLIKSRCKTDEGKRQDEKWIFFNGIATSYSMAQKSCDNLSATFGRPVIGVHNRSYGVIGDLVECLVQRSLRFYTQDTRVAQASLRAHLEDESIKKVVIIAHSQGGIIVSLILERLYTMLPAHLFAKLEIYTFGSAASHFHNPLISKAKAKSEPTTPGSSGILLPLKSTKSAPTSLQSPPPMPDRLIGTIEHYVNSRDLVPRWGVLYHVLLGSETTYSGRVFVHENATGHLFDQHYLEPMLPVMNLESIEGGNPKLFLNHKVKIGSSGLFRASTDVNISDKYQDRPAKPDEPDLDDKTGSADDEDNEMVEVKQLSRLWRYMGGRSLE